MILVRNRVYILFICLMIAAFSGCGAAPESPAEKASAAASTDASAPTQSPEEQVAELEQMCAEAREAIKARQEEQALFVRIGGREGIQAVVADTIAAHTVNDEIKDLMEGIDADHLIAQITDFLVIATGGEGKYNGRDMVAAHTHLNLTNADFLAAGADLGAAIEKNGWGENEKQEMLCAFVGLRDQVVTR